MGIKQPTQQSAVRDGERIKLLNTIGGEDPGGDGTVPRPSATPLEYEDDKGAAYSAERHASLQNDDHALLQLTGVLTGNEIDWLRFRGAIPTIDVSLDVEDLCPLASPCSCERGRIGILTRACSRSPSTSSLGTSVRGSRSRDATMAWHEAELGPLREGVYRVTVLGAGTVEPVTDLVTVLAE